MFDWLWSAGVGAGDDAAFGQSSGTARCAVKTATATSLGLRFGLLTRYEVACAPTSVFGHLVENLA